MGHILNYLIFFFFFSEAHFLVKFNAGKVFIIISFCYIF